MKARHISKSGLDDLVARIEGKDAALRAAGLMIADPVPIQRAVRTIGGREKPRAAVVLAMLAGDLPIVVDRSRTGRLMSRVGIPADRVHMLAGMTFDAGAHPSFAFDPRINRRDAEDVLNVNPKMFSCAVEAGQVPVPAAGTYDRAGILDLAEKLVSGREILARWGEGGRKMPEPMTDADRPARIGNLGWLRIDAEATLAKSTRC